MLQHASAQQLIAALVCAASAGAASAGDCDFGTGLDNITHATGFGAGELSVEHIYCPPCIYSGCIYTGGQLVAHRFSVAVDSFYGGVEVGALFDHDPNLNSWGCTILIIHADGPNAGEIARAYPVALSGSRIDLDAYGPGVHRVDLLTGAAPTILYAGAYVLIVQTRVAECHVPMTSDTSTFRIASADLDKQSPTGFVIPLPVDLPFRDPSFWPPDFELYEDIQPFNPAVRLDVLPIPQPDWICNPACPGDADGDGVVTLRDLNIVLVNFGREANVSCASGDLTTDCRVDLFDLFQVVEHFGIACP